MLMREDTTALCSELYASDDKMDTNFAQPINRVRINVPSLMAMNLSFLI